MQKLLMVSVLAAISLALPVLVSAADCPNLTRTLQFGSRGPDVAQLQTFLVSSGDLASGNATSYFGRLTEAAVKKFQCREMQICAGSGATNGYGVVGPRTRVAVRTACEARISEIIQSPAGGVSGSMQDVSTSTGQGNTSGATGAGAPVAGSFVPLASAGTTTPVLDPQGIAPDQRGLRLGAARVVPLSRGPLGGRFSLAIVATPQATGQVIDAYTESGAKRWSVSVAEGQVSGGFDLDADGYPDWVLYRRVPLSTQCNGTQMHVTWKEFYAGADGSKLTETEHVNDVCAPGSSSYAVSQWGLGAFSFGNVPWIASSRYYETSGRFMTSSGGYSEHRFVFPSVAEYDSYYDNDTSIGTVVPNVNQSYVLGSHVPTGVIVQHGGINRYVMFTSLRAAQYQVGPKTPTQLIADRPFIGMTGIGGRNYGVVGADPQDSRRVALVTGGATIAMFNDLFSQKVENEPDAGGERHVALYDLDANRIKQAFWSSVLVAQNGRDTHYHNRIIYPAHVFLSSNTRSSHIAYNRFADGKWQFEITLPDEVLPALTAEHLFVWDIVDLTGDGREEVIASPIDTSAPATAVGQYLPKWQTNIYTWDKQARTLVLGQTIPDAIPYITSSFPHMGVNTPGGLIHPVLVGKSETGGLGLYVLPSSARQLMTSIPLVSIALTPSSVNVLRETTVRPPGQNAVTPEPTCTLTANQSTAHAGQTVTLTWSSTNATNGGFSHGTGSDGTSGSKTLPTYPPETYYYTAYGPGGQKTCQVTIMPPPAAPTCSLTASKQRASYGETITVTWSSTNATNGGFSHGTGSDGTSGSKTLPTYPPETYYYTAYGPGGQAACSTQVSVM